MIQLRYSVVARDLFSSSIIYDFMIFKNPLGLVRFLKYVGRPIKIHSLEEV